MYLEEKRMIFKSKSIFTGIDKRYQEGFLVVEGEKIKEIYQSFGEIPSRDLLGAEFYDVGEKTILPGFIDSHIHVNLSALVYAGKIKLATGGSEEECVRSLVNQVDLKKLDEEAWLVGKDWYSPTWKNKVLPTKKSLDAYFPDIPVAMISADLHTLWVNSKGFEQLAFDQEYLSSHKEAFEKEIDTNEYTGVIKEGAAMAGISKILTESMVSKSEHIHLFFEQLLKMGITSVCDLAVLPDETQEEMDDQIYPEVYQYLEEQNKLKIRVHLFPIMQDDLDRIEHWQKKYRTEKLRVVGGKYFFDGVISTHTAFMKEVYENDPRTLGTSIVPPEKIKNKIMLAASRNLPLRIHAIGDRAIELAIDYFLEANEKYGGLNEGFHCLEHLEIIDPVDIKKLKKSGVVASVQPSHCLMDYPTVFKDVGRERETRMWPFQTLVDQGVPLAFGTDAPVVTNVSPLENIYYAVTRQTVSEEPFEGWFPAECMDVEEAILAQTREASKACSFSDKIGTLERGKFADFIVLSHNIEQTSSKKILQMHVEMTISNGEINYQETKNATVVAE